MIPIIIPVTEEEYESMSVDITDVPAKKEIFYFFVTLPIVWLIIGWAWTRFFGMTWESHEIFLSVTFSGIIAFLFNSILYLFRTLE